MTEAEVKVKIKDPEDIRRRLEDLGFLKKSELTEKDSYFDNASGQIRNGGMALRVRQITDHLSGSSQSVITFKGQRLDGISMSRQELETEVADGNTAVLIFEALGYRAVKPRVIKERREYVLDNMTACLDHVTDLGDFLELEIMVAEGEDHAPALEKIGCVLSGLGLSMAQTVNNSYLSMLQHTQDI